VSGGTDSLGGRHAHDDYGGSVPRGLAPRRPSHVASSRHGLARRRRPVRPLACAHCTSPLGQSVAWKKSDARHAESAGSPDVVPARVTVPPLETRVQAIQLSPCHAGVAGRSPTRLQTAPALPPCSCPVLLADAGKGFPAQSFALHFDHLRWQLTRCATRRTLSWHPAHDAKALPSFPVPHLPGLHQGQLSASGWRQGALRPLSLWPFPLSPAFLCSEYSDHSDGR
jgi:hypothetical protein